MPDPLRPDPRQSDTRLPDPRLPDVEGPARAAPLLALVGLAVLLCCTLPAVRAQHRLEARHARLARGVRAAEREVERLRRALRDEGQQGYLHTRATRALLHKGALYGRARR